MRTVKPDLQALRRAGEGALRLIVDMVAEDAVTTSAADQPVDATIVFADIEGFSDLVARHGDDAAGSVLDVLDAAVDQAMADTSCRLVKRLGDGVMLAAQDPGDGVSAAVALPQRFAEGISDGPFDLRVRVGAHRGIVRRRGDDLIGYHVNVAARVAEQAPGGTTLITGGLLESVVLSHRLLVRPAGRLVAKGVPERPPLYALSAVAASPAA